MINQLPLLSQIFAILTLIRTFFSLNYNNLLMTNLNNKKRIFWLDNLKFIGLFFVLIVHTGRLDSTLDQYIFSFFMPLFFFISGLLVKEQIKDESFTNFIKGKITVRIIPYFAFSFISYIFWFFVLNRINHTEKDSSSGVQQLIGIFYGVGSDDWLKHNISLWFLTCLFMTELLFLLYIKTANSKLTLMIILFLSSIIGYFYFIFSHSYTYHLGFYNHPIQYRLPWNLDLAFTATVFYGIGYLSQNYLINNLNKFNRWYFISFSLFIYLIFSHINEKVNFINGKYGNYFYFYLAALGGIFFWIYIARMIPPNIITKLVGQNSLVIFALHLLIFPLITGFGIYILKIPRDLLTEKSILIAVLYTLLTMGILVLLGILMTKFTPIIIGQSKLKKV